LRLEASIGSVEVGKSADLVGLGGNPFVVPASGIHELDVVLTMMDGRVTHSTG